MNPTLLFPESVQENTSFCSEAPLSLLDEGKIPRHVAIIMDGNRRWAQQHGLPPMIGHLKGAETLTRIVRAASRIGIKTLTVFSFSTENWNRPKLEIDGLMQLFRVYLKKQRAPMVKEGVRLCAIGDLTAMPKSVIRELELSQMATAECKKIDLVLAINYGGRDDIRRAFVSMLIDYEEGKLSKEDFSEQKIREYLDPAPWPDPEIIIRTSGEKRLSNFLLWQSSYSEFCHTDVLWPDFDENELVKAILDFQKRERRLGG